MATLPQNCSNRAMRQCCLKYRPSSTSFTRHQRHAHGVAAATVTVPASPMDLPHSPPTTLTSRPLQRYPPTQPPSYKPPELRKSQLLRQYTSLLRSTPLILVFQHNNLLAQEWAGIRRELNTALRKVSDAEPSSDPAAANDPSQIARIQTIQTSIFAAALRVSEYYHPDSSQGPIPIDAQHTHTPSHSLSRAAHAAATAYGTRKSSHAKPYHPLHALLSGPIALLSFPALSPPHLAAALSILAPTPGSGAASAFPAPRRRNAPGLYEAPVQAGLQKLMLLGARVEGRVMDQEGVKWVGGIKGGLEGLRAQVVGVLQGVGMGLVGGLEAQGMGLWGVMEGRKRMMEEESGAGEKKEEQT